MSKVARPFEGVVPYLERLYQESESEFTKKRRKAFMSPQPCDGCGGKRLKPEMLAVTLGGEAASSRFNVPESGPAQPPRDSQRLRIPGLSIMDVCALSIDEADAFFAELT